MVNIIILDNDISIVQVMKVWLNYSGHSVKTYINPRDFLDNLDALDYDIAFVDANPNGRSPTNLVDGFYIASCLKEHYPSSAVVLMSGDSSVLKNGLPADYFMAKPMALSRTNSTDSTSLEAVVDAMSDLVRRNIEARSRGFDWRIGGVR